MRLFLTLTLLSLVGGWLRRMLNDGRTPGIIQPPDEGDELAEWAECYPRVEERVDAS